MKIRSKILAAIVCAALTATAFSGFAAAEENTTKDGFVYAVRDDGIHITGYVGDKTDVVFPTEIDGSPVISVSVMGNTDITSVEIPGSVEIMEAAFMDCVNLERAVLDSGLTDTAHSGFWGCTKLKSVELPDTIREISFASFYECSSLEEIILPENLEEIGEHAFGLCTSLKRIRIPAKVEIIEYSFSGCDSLKYFEVDEDNLCFTDVDGVLFTKDMAALRFYPAGSPRRSYCVPDGVEYIDGSASFNADALLSVSLPDSVTGFPQAFEECDNLRHIRLPSGLEDFKGGYVFGGCSKLETIDIPENIECIYGATFEGCQSLKAIGLGANIKQINDDAFEGCDSLTDIYYAGSREDWDNIEFFSYSSTPNFGRLDEIKIHYNSSLPEQIPEGLEYAVGENGVEITGYNGKAAVVDVPLTIENMPVTRIGEWAFTESWTPEVINLPDTVNYLGWGAFNPSGYWNDNANWDGSLLYVGRHLVGSGVCDGTKIKDGTLTIGEAVFRENLSFIGTAEIPDSVTDINDMAFNSCIGITDVVIGSDVMNIGEYAFFGCDGITDVYYHGDEEDWAQINVCEGNEPILEANIHFLGDVKPKLSVSDFVVENGELVLNARTKNVPDGAALIAVSYGGDGNCVDMSRVSDGSVSLSAEGAGSVKVFCWESLENMRPLCPAAELQI